MIRVIDNEYLTIVYCVPIHLNNNAKLSDISKMDKFNENLSKIYAWDETKTSIIVFS